MRCGRPCRGAGAALPPREVRVVFGAGVVAVAKGPRRVAHRAELGELLRREAEVEAIDVGRDVRGRLALRDRGHAALRVEAHQHLVGGLGLRSGLGSG
eukprot:scaffold94644_cov57-Phaeocystis_antarctica.AAC.2